MCYPGIGEWTRDVMALTEEHEEKVQVCVGVKRADKRCTDKLRVEVGMKEQFKTKLARSSLT